MGWEMVGVILTGMALMSSGIAWFINGLNKRFEKIEEKMDERFDKLTNEMNGRFIRIEERLNSQGERLSRIEGTLYHLYACGEKTGTP